MTPDQQPCTCDVHTCANCRELLDQIDCLRNLRTLPTSTLVAEDARDLLTELRKRDALLTAAIGPPAHGGPSLDARAADWIADALAREWKSTR